MRTIPRFPRLRLGLSLGVAFSFIAVVPIARLHAAAVNPVPPLITKDKVAAHVGTFRGGSAFSANGAGRTGAAGDYSVDFTAGGTGPVYVADASFFNGPAAKDEVSVAFWTKKYDTAAGSAFWANSPSSNNGQRGYQAHVPWSDNTVFFDTAGCCGADTRISANIDTFPDYTGDISFWTNNWHHFVFSKKGGDKQIWIDGKLFLEATEGSAPLPTDFTDLYIGSDGAGNGLFHALVDDFSVFSTQLSEAEVQKLASGTSPSALPASDGLVAFWDFNDFPAEGEFISVSPTPNTTTGSPNTISVVHVDGATPWTQANVSLKLDGQPVTATFSKNGNRATVGYVSPTLLAIQSTHTITLTYPGANGAAQTLEWQFTVAPYTKDSVASRVGAFTGGSTYTADANGRSGKPGDYAVDFGRTGSGPVQIDGAFLNAATAQDELSFGLWIKKYDIVASSAFWAVSPSSSSNERGFQAHVPWDNNNIYFDTAGCCDGGTQRINGDIATFPDYSGDVSWWTNWHYLVFSKKADDKQIWIDGKLFLEGSNTAPLPTDFTRLVIGADDVNGNLIHGVIDDFAVFSKQLTEAQIQSLAGGAKATDVDTSAGLLAFFDFNDVPAQGIFLSFLPTPDSTNAVPNKIQIVHLQGTPWDLSKVSLTVDSTAVTPTTSKTGNQLTVSYAPAQSYAIGSTHSVVLSYPNPDGTTGTKSWQFTVGPYTQDKVHQYPGMLLGPTVYTADAGGHSGKAGDYAVDLGAKQAGQGVRIIDPTPLNQAAANDEISIVGWQKLQSLVNSAFFFGVAPSANGGARGFGAFPWSNGNIYFDTAGCCDGATQRINAGIDTFPDYTGDPGWWTNWHHFVYQKKGSTKEVWIDGKLFLQGDSSAPLPTDFTEGDIGVDVPDNARLQGVLDDVAIFGTSLDEATIGQLANGTLPSALPASAKLLAYWDFNDAKSSSGGEKPSLTISSIAGGKVRITYTGTLESTDALGGGWSPVQGATSPYEVATATGNKFYRAKN